MSEAMSGFVGVLFGALVTISSDQIAKWRQRERDRLYLAITIATHLDRFVAQCADVATDDGTHHGQVDPVAGRTSQTTVPTIDFSEIKVEWRSLPTKLLYDVLSFPNEVNQAMRALSDVGDNDFPPYDDYYFARRHTWATLGVHAFKISNKLRAQVKLNNNPYMESTTRWLLEQHADLEAKRIAHDERIEKSNAKLHAEMSRNQDL